MRVATTARWLESAAVQRVIIGLIVINGITLGLETYPGVVETAGTWLQRIDRIILTTFVLEIGLRMAIYRGAFLRDPWSLFDFIVIAIALIPTSGAWSVLRIFRILRVLRLVSTVPALRQVVAALISAIPGLGAIITLMSLMLYVAAVIVTGLYGAAFPALFGTLGHSLYSLFQVMTLEGWSADIVKPVMAQFPLAWLFFVPFILLTTFTMLNLFIGIIVATMQRNSASGPTTSAAESAAAELINCRQQLQVISVRIEMLNERLSAQATNNWTR